MGKKFFGLFLVLMVGVLLTACGGSEDASSDSSGDDASLGLSGEQMYMQSCSSCHGADLKQGYAPDLDQIGAKYSAEEIEEIIVNGVGNMPKGIIKGEDAKKVADWLATHQ